MCGQGSGSLFACPARMPSIHGKLSGKVTVITGASSGVGRAIASAFAREGASIGLIARSADGLEGAASEVRALGKPALVLPVDVSDASAVDSAAERDVGVGQDRCLGQRCHRLVFAAYSSQGSLAHRAR